MQVTKIEGAAGTGKTMTLRNLARAHLGQVQSAGQAMETLLGVTSAADMPKSLFVDECSEGVYRLLLQKVATLEGFFGVHETQLYCVVEATDGSR